MADLRGEAKARYVAAMFARIARRYDMVNTVMTVGAHHRWRRQTVRMAIAGNQGMALDVATGTGDLAFALANRPEVASVVGVDTVPEMMAVARQKAQRRGVSERVSFLQGDALALPFPSDTFACATAGFSMRNVTDVPAAVAEMARVVRPGGRVAILEIIPFERDGPLPQMFRLYFHRVVPTLGALLAGDHDAYTYLPQSVDAFLSVTDMVWLMSQIGLRSVRYRRVALGAVTILVGRKP